MAERLRYGVEYVSGLQQRVFDSLAARFDAVYPVNHPEIRRLLSMFIRDIEIDDIPEWLADGKQRLVLASNYPGVQQTLLALVGLACSVPGDQLRLNAIARQEVVDNAVLWQRILRLPRAIIPAVKKTDTGGYELGLKAVAKARQHLETPGALLWISLTGQIEPKDLSEELVKPGAGWFSLMHEVPIAPLALHTIAVRTRRGMQTRVRRISFGEPFEPPLSREEVKLMVEPDRAALYIEQSLQAMARVKELLARD